MRKTSNVAYVAARMAAWEAYQAAARRADTALRQWCVAARFKTASPERCVRGSFYWTFADRCWQRFSSANDAAKALYEEYCVRYGR